MTEENLEESAKRKGLRGTFGSAREAIGGSLDKVTGADFRRQFEQFTNVVETTVVGIHRDQQELNKKLEKLEQSANVVETAVAGIRRDQQELDSRLEQLESPTPAVPTPPTRTQKLVIAAFAFSAIAIILALVAVFR